MLTGVYFYLITFSFQNVFAITKELNCENGEVESYFSRHPYHIDWKKKSDKFSIYLSFSF